MRHRSKRQCSTMTSSNDLQILPLADFKPVSASRAWVSIPNPNGLPLIATATSDKTVRVYSLKNFTLHSTLEGGHSRSEHTADVKCVRWRKDDGNGELLASASYDDTIRFWRGDDEGEWSCVAVLEGHAGTIWSLDWEPDVSQRKFASESEQKVDDYSPKIPRLISASADCTIRVWAKAPTPPPPNKPSYFNTGIPSTMRAPPSSETWECTATLPKVHTLPIYAVNWSSKTGRVVSTGGDGKLVVYEERTKGRTSVGGAIEREWAILGILEGGHGPYEINHVAWCQRFDTGRTEAGEEMLITSGDDGVVRAWRLHDVPGKSDVGAAP
ncbi:hypothetical protein BUE80_DR010352 [Diplocarpon rosae]|nr:hypothetical protein BUE80_DR010352 [Diplocarpon rosae]